MNDGLILTVLYKEPGEKAVVKQIINSEEEMSELVHGKIDSIGVDDGVCAIFNGFGEVLKMTECCTIYDKTFYGPVLLVEFSEKGELASLEKDNIEYYKNLFGE